MTDRRAPPEPLQSRQPSFERFFDHHPREHGRPETRALRFTDTGLALTDRRWRLWVPLAGYGPAWRAHFWMERHRPAIFRHPTRSPARRSSHAAAPADRPARGAAPAGRRAPRSQWIGAFLVLPLLGCIELAYRPEPDDALAAPQLEPAAYDVVGHPVSPAETAAPLAIEPGRAALAPSAGAVRSDAARLVPAALR